MATTCTGQQEVEELLATTEDITFEEEHWNILIIECTSLAAEWEKVSGCLGLSFKLIDSIKKDHPNDSTGCFNEALKQWIQQKYNTKMFDKPSWRTLLKAIVQVDRLLFQNLAIKHQAEVAINNTKKVNGSTKERHTISQSNGAEQGSDLDTCIPKIDDTKSQSPTLPSIDPEEKRMLYFQLSSESQDMIYKFQKLFSATRKSLRDEKVSVSELLHHLECLGSIRPTYKDAGQNSSPLRCQLPELVKATNVDDIMSVVKDYCSFFNYQMLEHIITEFGTEKDKENLKQYKEEFNNYAKHCIIECPSEVGRMNEGYATMVVILDDSFENCTWSHLSIFVRNLRKVLNIPSDVALRLCRINPGSIILTFQLPHFVQQDIFPLSGDQEKELAALDVTGLSCEDYCIQLEELEDANNFQFKGDISSADIQGLPELAVETQNDSHTATDSVADSTDTTGEVSDDSFNRELHDANTEVSCKVLYSAACRGDLNEVRQLTEEECLNPLTTDENGRNVLHYTARGGDIYVLKYFIEERGHNPGCVDHNGWTLLHVAANFGHFKLVQYLIVKWGINPFCLTKARDTPLHKACMGGNIDIVRYLVSRMSQLHPLGDVLDCRGNDGQAPMHMAALHGHLEIVKFFVNEMNCDPNITQNMLYLGRTPLHNAAQEGHLEIVRFLIEQKKCNPLHKDNQGVTPLHMAALYGRLNIVEYLILDQECDPACTDDFNDTPLHAAASGGQLEVVKFFVETLNCSPEIRGQLSMTPLALAHSQHHYRVVQYLESIISAKLRLEYDPFFYALNQSV